jgi:SWI/SNF-related matrix-associated actin-dependent regulator 1 of chromatin subfamily A
VSLFPYQVKGVEFLKSHRKAFLFDDPGLGKTRQNLEALNASLPTLVICPKAAKSVWANETLKWRKDLRPKVIEGRKNFKWPTTGEVVIINPAIIPDQLSIIAPPSQMQLVVDECHNFKNTKSKQSQALQKLTSSISGGSGSVWMCTGTPILTSPMDLWGLISACGIIKETYDTWENFKRLFKGYDFKISRYVTITKFPSKPMDGALDPLKPYVLRRKREEVLPDLPTKIYETYKVPAKFESSVVLTEEEIEAGAVYQPAVATWRKQVSYAKAGYLSDYFQGLCDEGQLVIFTSFRDTVDIVCNELRHKGITVESITGEDSSKSREDAAASFQKGNVKAIVGTIGAMGVALTLTRSHRVVFIDRDWTPALNKQAEDRVCRIGQNRGVVVTDITCDDPIDEMVTRVLVKKTQLLENTVEKL